MVAKFRNSGQTCVCASRFIVQSAIHDRFVERLVAAVEGLTVGDGPEPGTEPEPLVNPQAVDEVRGHIADAVGRGGAVAAGGRSHALGGTFFVEPTVLTGVTAEAAVAREETSGPLAPVVRIDTEEEAVALANDTEHGLAAHVSPRDPARAFRVAEALRCGMVGVDEGLITTEVAPFDGLEQSGLGRDGSRYGLDDDLDLTYVCLGGL